jgi:hypothetical protein
MRVVTGSGHERRCTVDWNSEGKRRAGVDRRFGSVRAVSTGDVGLSGAGPQRQEVSVGRSRVAVTWIGAGSRGAVR